MEYIVSARKYRPMTFDSVVGQSALTTTLKNAVLSGKLAHAYLFCGPRGVGKTTCARIFAKVINCLHPTPSGDACGECESCKAFNEGRSLNIFELDAASNNSVENIKQLMEQTHIPPQTGRYKVFIIDEVHMLSTAAFNAFLKTLEEPPSHVIFILATTEKHKILPTIISRCQIYDFERMSVQNIIAHLKDVAEKEGYTYEEEALNVIAEKADGGMRDALSIFDQAASFCGGNITYQKVLEDLNVLDADNYFRIIDLAVDNKVSDIMLIVNQLLAKGFDAGQMINGLAAHVRNILMAVDPQTTQLIEASNAARQKYAEQAKHCLEVSRSRLQVSTPKFLYDALKILNQCDVNYRQSSNKRLLCELALIQVAQITQKDDNADADVSHGPRPCMTLKSLFKNLMLTPQPRKAAPQVAQAEGESSSMISYDNKNDVKASSAPIAAKTSTPKIKLNGLGSSFHTMLHKGQDNKKEEDEALSLGEDGENLSFTEDDLRKAWLNMCNRMMQSKDYNALAKRMMNVQMKIVNGGADANNLSAGSGQVAVTEGVVENSLLMNDMMKVLPRIRATLIKILHNSKMQFSLRLAEQEEIAKRLSPHEAFQKLIETNPSFAAFQRELKLNLDNV